MTAVSALSVDPGFDIRPTTAPMGFRYGPGVFGPQPELRTLDAIRPSLLDPACTGPDPVYAIAMDVGTDDARADLLTRQLLFGVVTYAAGSLGDEPVRSQGHVHAVSASCSSSTPELYEIWAGRAVILMQETAEDDPGRCMAVEAGPGELVVVPPGWAHATISADPSQPLTFGAWCVRDFGFDYTGVRAHGGLAWYPVVTGAGLDWRPNDAYPVHRPLDVHAAREYPDLGLAAGTPIWQQYREDPDRVMWVARPERPSWTGFTP